MERNIIAGTGHRPDKLLLDGRNAYDTRVFARLVDLAAAALTKYQPTLVISGMALGWDQALAQAAVNLGVPFDAYVPFEGQEGKWRAESQAQFRQLLAAAQSVVYCSEPGYAAWKLQRRNERMVDDSDLVLALWDGSDGGTANCLRYVKTVGRKYINVWPSWVRYGARAA